MADTALGIQVEDNTRRGTQGVIKNFKRIQDEAKKTEKSSRNLKGQFVKTEKGMFSNLGKYAALAGGFGVVTVAITKSVKAALLFTTAMGEVSTLLPAGSKDVGILSENIKKLSIQFGLMPTDQAKAAYQIISAGASNAAEATAILTVANKLAIGGVTDVETAADGLTTILNSYGLATSDAADVSDKLFVAMKAGKTNIAQMSASIGNVAPLAAQAGASLTEVLSATAALTKGGQSTSVAMTGIRAILAALVKPTKEASDLAGQLGIQFDAAGLKAKGLQGILAEVGEKTGGSAEKMALLFGGVEALVPAMALMGKASGDFNQAIESMGNSAGQTEEALDKMMSTPQKKLDKLLSGMEVASVSFGESLLNRSVIIIDFLNQILDKYNLLGQVFDDDLVRAPDAAQGRAENAFTGGSGSTGRQVFDISNMETLADKFAKEAPEAIGKALREKAFSQGAPLDDFADQLARDLDGFFEIINNEVENAARSAANNKAFGASLRQSAFGAGAPKAADAMTQLDIAISELAEPVQDFTLDLEGMEPAGHSAAQITKGVVAGLDAIGQMAPEVSAFTGAFSSLIQGDYLGAAVQGFAALTSVIGPSTEAQAEYRREMEKTLSLLEQGASTSQDIIEDLFSGDVTSGQSDVLGIMKEWFDFFQGGGYGDVSSNADAVREMFDRLSRLDATGTRALDPTAELFKITGGSFADFRAQVDEAFGSSSTFSEIAEMFFDTSDAFDDLRDSTVAAKTAVGDLTDAEKAATRLRVNAQEIGLRTTLGQDFKKAGSDQFERAKAFKRFEGAVAALRQSATQMGRGSGGVNVGSTTTTTGSTTPGSTTTGGTTTGNGSILPTTTITPQVTVNPVNLSPEMLVTVPTEEQFETYYSIDLLPHISNPLLAVTQQVSDNVAANKVTLRPWHLFSVPSSKMWAGYWGLFLLKRADSDTHGPDNVADQIKKNTIANKQTINPGDMFSFPDSSVWQGYWDDLLPIVASVGTQDQTGGFSGGYGPQAAAAQIKKNTIDNKQTINPTDMFSYADSSVWRGFWDDLLPAIASAGSSNPHETTGGYGPQAAASQVVGNINPHTILPTDLFKEIGNDSAGHFRSYWEQGLHKYIVGENYGPNAAIQQTKDTINKWTLTPSEIIGGVPNYSAWFDHFKGLNLDYHLFWGLWYALRGISVRVNLVDLIDFNASGVQEAINTAVQDAINDRQYDDSLGYGSGRA